jgi:hypothetical protein
MKGREQRHFQEKNEASTHIDRMFHYKICLWGEERAEQTSVLELGVL